MRVEVVVHRGPIAESRHHVEFAAVTSDGRLTDGTANAGLVTTFRSAAKPFQLLPLVERGHAARFGFSDEELAIMASSHTGSAYHVEKVRGILARIGLEERHLGCGYHEPLDAASRAAIAAGAPQGPIWNNCSGKHSGMLALSLGEGWPVEGYLDPTHPAQVLIRRTVAECCGVEPAAVLMAVDGCSAPVFGLPLAAMARGYAMLAVARNGRDARSRALDLIGRSMAAFPIAVAGEGRLSTVLMQAGRGQLIAKGGAEGLECAAVPGSGLGVALKCEDGQMRAVGPALITVLDRLGALDAEALRALESHRRPVVRNHAGLEVGRLETVVHTTAAALTDG
jgi:L-asparaginase II